MFKYTNTITGESITVENPRYVKKDEREIWVRCDEKDAECVAVNGDRFSIAGKPPVEDAPDTVAVEEVDIGDAFSQLLIDALNGAQDIEDVKAAIEDIYDAVLDIYENGV